MSAMSQARHIKYLALAYNGKILASHYHWNKEESSAEKYEDVTMQIFASPGWSAARGHNKSKLELKSDKNTYCMEMDDSNRVYVAVVSRGYPTKYIFSAPSGQHLMTDFAAHVKAVYPLENMSARPADFKRSLTVFLRELGTRYDDLMELEHASKTQLRRDDIATAMNHASRHAEQQPLLASQSRTYVDSSVRSAFQRSAGLHKRNCRLRCRCSCICVTVVVMILLLLVGVVVGLNFSTYHWW